jgi:hypothetical protein
MSVVLRLTVLHEVYSIIRSSVATPTETTPKTMSTSNESSRPISRTGGATLAPTSPARPLFPYGDFMRQNTPQGAIMIRCHGIFHAMAYGIEFSMTWKRELWQTIWRITGSCRFSLDKCFIPRAYHARLPREISR